MAVPLRLVNTAVLLFASLLILLLPRPAFASSESGVFVDAPVPYTISFDANGGNGSMDDFAVTTAVKDETVTRLPRCEFSRTGYTFDHWETVVPEFVHLDAVSVADEHEFKGLSWELSEGDVEPIAWTSPMTLQSFADKQNHIRLKAIWRNERTGRLEVDPPTLSLFTSSLTSEPLYLYTWGTHGFLSTSTAPEGYSNKTKLVDVPTESNTPMFQMRHPSSVNAYFFTIEEEEYNLWANDGWVQQGIAFYTDDAKGIRVNRFIHLDDYSYTYSRANELDGYECEEMFFYGLKYFNVVYDGNGATAGEMPQQRMQYGISYRLEPCAFARENYQFVGWQGSNGKRYADGATVNSITTVSEGTVTMTALWELVNYNVSFDANGGQAAFPLPGFTTDADKVVRDPGCSYTRPGFAFAGWNTEADGSGQQLDPAGSVTLEGDEPDVMLYAQWQPLQLELDIPARIDMYMDAQGHMRDASLDHQVIQNNGRATVSLDSLRVMPQPGFEFVSSDPLINQSMLLLRDKANRSCNLAHAVGTYKPLFKNDSCYIRANDAFEFALEGECGGIDDLNGEGEEFVTLEWTFSLSTVTLSYDCGPSHGLATQQANRGDLVAVASCSPTSESFLGWSTRPDGTGTRYASGESIRLEDDVTLYAQWAQ